MKPQARLSAPTSEKRSQNTALMLFLLALVVGGAAVVFGWKTRAVEGAQTIDLTNVEQRRQLEISVNRHIQMTNRRIEIEKEKIRIEAGFAIPRVGTLVVHERRENPTAPLDLRGDRTEYNAARDTERRATVSQAQAADVVIHSEMADIQQRNAAEEIYRAEYARQYVEDARRNGYEVKLDAENRVISVRELSPNAIRTGELSAGDAYR